MKLQHLSGPLGIVRIYYLLFENERGWQLALWFSVILNVNLAILNMLPIPVLDGGHIVLALVEGVRRKPVNIRVLEIIQTGCAVLIIGYIAYISFFDVGDLLGEKRGTRGRADRAGKPEPVARYCGSPQKNIFWRCALRKSESGICCSVSAVRYCLTNGGSVAVEHPEFMALSPKGDRHGLRRRWRVIIDVPLIVALKSVQRRTQAQAVNAYCDDPLRYQRRLSREVMVGHVGVGGANPIRVQSMITCDTMDTEASIAQTLELAQVGCEIVRITAPTVKDAANLQHIVAGLRARGCDVPIVADIHFKPEAALEAAKWVEKVRINPGNYADSKKFKIIEYTDEQYAAELERIRERFTPLVKLCQERGIAMRIGTNHGSLSDRIMNRYGDTPLGMVESALEFARIARDLDYHALHFLDEIEQSEGDDRGLPVARGPTARSKARIGIIPIHLGVTEAGEGEDARIKSAIGIGSLLRDGIGDTIRVSLTEDSVHEIPVARALIESMWQWSPARRIALNSVASVAWIMILSPINAARR